MTEFLLLDPEKHKDVFFQMGVDLMQWHIDELLDNYGVDTFSLLGVTAEDIVNNSIDSYLKQDPSKGVVYLLSVNDKIAGMLALTRIGEKTGELHRMWIHPEFRGKGYSRPLLEKVLKEGRHLSCSRILLSTPKFAYAAQYLYKSVGFIEIEEYPESEVAKPLRQYWIYMEKRD